jgi:uncharacterized membrane protein YqgA involved in biofilm formation
LGDPCTGLPGSDCWKGAWVARAPARVAADFTFASSLTTFLIGPMYSRIATSDAWFTGLFHCVLSVDVMANAGCCLVLGGLVGKTKNAEEQFASVGEQVQKRHERQIRARLVEAARSKLKLGQRRR